ncbi:MAG: acyl-CoA thioesterase [Bacteroidales bacterium]|nr:acyl-CoA thioesterase [Bacteroidales bacterium]
MLQTKTQFRVRYADTDKMGVVYHSNYAVYFEVGRTEMFREIGLSYNEMEKNNLMLPLVDLYINYKRPALYDDMITVTTTVTEMPNVKIRFDYEIHNEQGELLVTGYATLVFIDMLRNRPMRMPDNIRALLEPYFA